MFLYSIYIYSLALMRLYCITMFLSTVSVSVSVFVLYCNISHLIINSPISQPYYRSTQTSRSNWICLHQQPNQNIQPLHPSSNYHCKIRRLHLRLHLHPHLHHSCISGRLHYIHTNIIPIGDFNPNNRSSIICSTF